MGSGETVEQTGTITGEPSLERTPGAVIVFSVDAPVLIPMMQASGSILLGRDNALFPEDERLSRRNAELQFDGTKWTVRDLGSRNGTYVDGEKITGSTTGVAPLVRVGRTLVICVADVRPFLAEPLTTTDGFVAGPSLQLAHRRIEQVAASGGNLLITGETGTGKEQAARVFHAAGSHKTGPMVTVNCANIPEGVAERLLFGAKRGAYSGAAADVPGYIQAADHGVLFLDEFGEIESAVQPKLLRVLESGQVLALGATTPRPIDVRYCFATNRDLRAAVRAGTFRSDLFFRMNQPEVKLPPLRERREEIPTLMVQVLRSVGSGLSAHFELVEACLARPWPGNVRELLRQVEQAARRALDEGKTSVRLEHLDPEAGTSLEPVSPEGGELGGASFEPEASGAPKARGAATREQIETALRECNGNVSATAEKLGIHRKQLYRLMFRFGLKEPSGTR